MTVMPVDMDQPGAPFFDCHCKTPLQSPNWGIQAIELPEWFEPAGMHCQSSEHIITLRINWR